MKKCRIWNIILGLIMDLIKEVMEYFEWISITHVFEDLISQVDELSKQALILQEVTLIEYEFRRGIL
jgi:hypothetical protein